MSEATLGGPVAFVCAHMVFTHSTQSCIVVAKKEPSFARHHGEGSLQKSAPESWTIISIEVHSPLTAFMFVLASQRGCSLTGLFDPGSDPNPVTRNSSLTHCIQKVGPSRRCFLKRVDSLPSSSRRPKNTVLWTKVVFCHEKACTLGEVSNLL